MATRAQPRTAIDTGELLGAEPLGDFVLIATAQIDRGERLRPIDPVWASALGQVMEREGQRTPIEVCRLPGADRWTLVSGGHRHAAAEKSDIAYLRAEIVGADSDDRRMREVSENLWRRDLKPVDRAAFIAEAVAIHKRRAGVDPSKDGRAGSISARWQRQLRDDAVDTNVTLTKVYGFADDVANDLGFSRSAVERDLMLFRRLVPSAINQLRSARHPILGNATQLRAIAKLDADEQARVVALLTSDDPARPKTASDAIARVKGSNRATDPEAKRLSAFIGTFSRMTLTEKKGALAQLAGMLPAGFALGERDGPVAPAGGAVLSKTGMDAIIAGLSVAEFYLPLIEPPADADAHEAWSENKSYVDKALRVATGARVPA